MENLKPVKKMSNLQLWLLIWGLGLAGQFCWNMENQWFNTFVYAKIVKDPTIISVMIAISAAVTTFSTFFFGTISDRRGSRRKLVSIGYILWGIFTIAFGCTQFIANGSTDAALLMVAGIAVVGADAIMSFFGSMGNDGGFNAWTNDMMTPKNRGQIGAALATQPVIGTIIGTVVGGMLVGAEDNYMRLFITMGVFVILVGVIALFTLKDSPTLKPTKDGSFWHQFLSVFNFKKFIERRELLWVNITLSVFFIAFNVYFAHLGNYMIYYLGFDAGTMGLIEGLSLILALALSIPAITFINKNKSPYVCMFAIVMNLIGILILGFFVRPTNVDPSTLFNWTLMLGVFFIGSGYVVILQTLMVWSKQLYPADAKGQFEGIRILFFVLIPMVIAPLIANPVIKANGAFLNEFGLTEYLPTETLFYVAAVLVVFTFIPLFIAKKHHDARIKTLSEHLG